MGDGRKHRKDESDSSEFWYLFVVRCVAFHPVTFCKNEESTSSTAPALQPRAGWVGTLEEIQGPSRMAKPVTPFLEWNGWSQVTVLPLDIVFWKVTQKTRGFNLGHIWWFFFNASHAIGFFMESLLCDGLSSGWNGEAETLRLHSGCWGLRSSLFNGLWLVDGLLGFSCIWWVAALLLGIPVGGFYLGTTPKPSPIYRFFHAVWPVRRSWSLNAWSWKRTFRCGTLEMLMEETLHQL